MNNYQVIRSRFVELFKTEPMIFRAPGRINLIGEHTDYNDGFVMPAAIDKEIVVAIAEATDGVCVIDSVDMNDSYTVDLKNIKKAETSRWVNYLLGVIDKVQQQGYIIKPFKCVFGGNVPVGAGLSSSAALECGFVVALNGLFDLNIPKTDMVLTAQWSEHNYAGVKCGIMDQFSSMMGKADHVFMLDCRSLEYKYFPLTLNGYEILLFDTNVKHSLASSEYNTRRKECEEGVSILKKTIPSITNLRDVSSDTIRQNKGNMPEKVYNRCLYVTEEIERVQAAGKNLVNGDLRAFGKKMYETHEGLSKLYEVSCAELDFLVDNTKENPDVLGARMMGGGFGGCTINIVKSTSVDSLIESVKKAYHAAFGVESTVYKVKVRDGAGLVEHFVQQ